MSERYITHHCAIQGPESQVLAQVSRKPAGDLIERLERICQHKFASRDMLIHDCALGHITLGDIADLCAAVRTSDFSLAAQINDLEDHLNAEAERADKAEAQLADVKQSLTTGDLVSREVIRQACGNFILHPQADLSLVEHFYMGQHSAARAIDAIAFSLPAAPAVRVDPLVSSAIKILKSRVEDVEVGMAADAFDADATGERADDDSYEVIVSYEVAQIILAALEGGEA